MLPARSAASASSRSRSSSLSACSDWTDAAICDPARDLALIYRDLGPEIFELMVACYDGRFDVPDRERAVFYARCKLIEDIAYGVRTCARRYAEVCLCHLARTFGALP
jgi:hypothetical protein